MQEYLYEINATDAKGLHVVTTDGCYDNDGTIRYNRDEIEGLSRADFYEFDTVTIYVWDKDENLVRTILYK